MKLRFADVSLDEAGDGVQLTGCSDAGAAVRLTSCSDAATGNHFAQPKPRMQGGDSLQENRAENLKPDCLQVPSFSDCFFARRYALSPSLNRVCSPQSRVQQSPSILYSALVHWTLVETQSNTQCSTSARLARGRVGLSVVTLPRRAASARLARGRVELPWLTT